MLRCPTDTFFRTAISFRTCSQVRSFSIFMWHVLAPYHVLSACHEALVDHFSTDQCVFPFSLVCARTFGRIVPPRVDMHTLFHHRVRASTQCLACPTASAFRPWLRDFWFARTGLVPARLDLGLLLALCSHVGLLVQTIHSDQRQRVRWSWDAVEVVVVAAAMGVCCRSRRGRARTNEGRAEQTRKHERHGFIGASSL